MPEDGGGVGNQMSNVVPAPGRERIAIVPPSASTRSCMLVRPNPVLTDALRVETHPVVGNRQRQVAVGGLEVDRDRARLAVLECVVQRFLHDAIQRYRDLARQLGGTASWVNTMFTSGRANSVWRPAIAGASSIKRSRAG